MQTELTRTILKKVPLLSDEQQRKILEITETFLSGKETETTWGNQNSILGESELYILAAFTRRGIKPTYCRYSNLDILASQT
jgi:hypothetical protein